VENFNTPVTEHSKDEWLTPPAIIKSLGDFDLEAREQQAWQALQAVRNTVQEEINYSNYDHETVCRIEGLLLGLLNNESTEAFNLAGKFALSV
jgi:hypothetical protein